MPPSYNARTSQFTEYLVCLNKLHFDRWIFEPGMLFHAGSKWWGDEGARECRHTGLDLHSYETPDGKQKTLREGSKIPIAYEGRIVKCMKDFIGYTILAAHEIYHDESRLFTIYGHVTPALDTFSDKLLVEGTVIAALAGTESRKVPPHLHVSIALIPKTMPPESLTWKTMDEDSSIVFLDPWHII